MKLIVDPTTLTNFKYRYEKLEAVMLFCVLVANKQAIPTANRLTLLLKEMRKRRRDITSPRPFKLICTFLYDEVYEMVKMLGFGCHQLKARAIYELAHSDLHLRKCTLNELESLYGVGPKTARMFLVHTRPAQKYAILDTHILRQLRDLGYETPRSTPTSRRSYAEIENKVLALADAAGLTPADWDLQTWNNQRTKGLTREISNIDAS